MSTERDRPANQRGARLRLVYDASVLERSCGDSSPIDNLSPALRLAREGMTSECRERFDDAVRNLDEIMERLDKRLIPEWPSRGECEDELDVFDD